MLVCQKRRAKRLKQGAIDGIALRIVLGVPLHAEGKSRRVGNTYCLNRTVLRRTLDHHSFTGLEDALPVQ